MTKTRETCPVTGLTILQKPQWSDIPISGGYTVTFRMVGDRILHVAPHGHSTKKTDIDKVYYYREQVLAECSQPGVKIVEIKDYKNITGTPSRATRLTNIRYFENENKRCLGFIAFNASWKMRLIIRVGLKFHNPPYPFEVCSDYSSAVIRATQMLRDFDEKTGFGPDDFLSREEWKYTADDGYSAECRVLKNKVLYSIHKGYLQKHHVDHAIGIPLQIYEKKYIEHSHHYQVADFSAVTGGTWPARFKYIKELRKIYATYAPPRAIIIVGGSRPVITALKLVEKRLGIQMLLVKNFDEALSRIKEKELEPPGKIDDGEAAGEPYEKYIDEIMDFIASFTWDTPGKKPGEIADSHPFKPVFDAISLIKLDIDDLLIEQAKAQLQLMEKEERYRNLFQYSGDAILLLDENGVFDCNESTLKIFKVEKAADFLGLQPWEFSPPVQPNGVDSRRLVLEEIKTAREQGSNRFEWEHRRFNGETFPAEVLLNEVELGGKAILQLVVRDITARKKTEAEIEKAHEEAALANNAKSDFLANISHEIRTPLNGIMGMTDLLLVGRVTEEQRDYLMGIKSCGQSLMDIIDEIIDLSKIEAGKIELKHIPFEIDGMIQGVLRILAVKAHQKKLELLCDIGHDIPGTVVGDTSRIRQVLLNLVGNAVKFTNEGEVRLSIKKKNETPGAVILEFSVSDTGVGIAADKIASLFNKFSPLDSSTTRKHGGTGLGLAIAQDLVHLMGGHIEVQSTLGKGSRFFFEITLEKTTEKETGAASMEIEGREKQSRATGVYRVSIKPVQTAVAGEEEQPRSPLANPTSTSTSNPKPGEEKSTKSAKLTLTVLLAEDNPINRKLVGRLLKLKGWEVLDAENGLDVVRKYEENKNKVDAILMDIQMPEMDGYEAAEKIRELEAGTGRHVPIIALTAHALPNYQEKSYAAGMDAYITKPIDKEEMYRLLQQLTVQKQ